MAEQGLIPIVVPSHKRPNALHVLGAISNVIVCIPEAQAESYRQANPDVEFVTHPDEVLGISNKRQWMYEKFGDMFMVDDDVTRFTRMMIPPKGSWMAEVADETDTLTPDEAYDVVQQLAQVAREMGAMVYGLSHSNNPTYAKPMEPFSFNKFISAATMGLFKSPHLFFPSDEPAKVCEDNFMVLLNAHYHRYALVDNRYGIERYPTSKNTGGMGTQRTVDLEKQAFFYLKEKFGAAVQRKQSKGGGAGYSHEWERKIVIPY